MRRSTARSPGSTGFDWSVAVHNCPKVSGTPPASWARSSIFTDSQSVKPGPSPPATASPVQIPKLFTVTWWVSTRYTRQSTAIRSPATARNTPSTTMTMPAAAGCCVPNTMAPTPSETPSRQAKGNERTTARTTASAVLPPAEVAASIRRSIGFVSGFAWNSRISPPSASSPGTTRSRSKAPVGRPCSAAAPSAAPIAPADAPPRPRNR